MARAYVNEWAPKRGWDSANDIKQAKRFIRGQAFAALPGKKGNAIIFDLAMRARDYGVSQQTAGALIVRYAETDITKGKIEDICANAYTVAMVEPGTLSVAPAVKIYNEDAWMEGEKSPTPSRVWRDGSAKVWPTIVSYDPKQHAAKCADLFMEARPAPIIVSNDVYYSLEDSGVWRPIAQSELVAELRLTDPMLVFDTGKLVGMANAIRAACHTKVQPLDWLEMPADAPLPSDLVIAGNGILNIETGALLPHDGSFFLTGHPDWDYDPEADCPFWIEKLLEWLDPSFHDTLQEFMGYMLTPDMRSEKFLAMIGVTRGGKGTITRIQQALVGKHHHVSRTLGDLGNGFGLEGTLDKRVIFIPDAHDTDIATRGNTLERIKCIVGNDEVSVNIKHQPLLTAKIPAKIVLVANKPPKFLDESGALAERQLPIIFENSFSGREDRDLAAKLQAELSGIANWALEGLRRLRSNEGKFTVGERGIKASRELAESQSPALRFATDRLVVTGDTKDYVPIDFVFDSYTDWSVEVEALSLRERRNRTEFKSDLLAALTTHGVNFGQRRWHDPKKPKLGKGKPTRGFYGIKLKPYRRDND